MSREQIQARIRELTAQERALRAPSFGTGKPLPHGEIFAIWQERLKLKRELEASGGA